MLMKMKKVLGLALASVMTISMAAAAFAEEGGLAGGARFHGSDRFLQIKKNFRSG